MIAQYNRKSLYWGIPGAWLHLSGVMVLVAHDGIADITTRTVILVGTVLLMIGLSYYAKAKGRNGFWGLFGFLGIIGVIVLACLKNISPEAIEARMHPETQIRTSRLAAYSLVLGIASLVTLCLTAVPGLILGIVALDKIKKNPEALKGRGLAIAGIVVSSVFCAFLLLNWRAVSLVFSSFFAVF
jgi:uncharacterized membrane protein YhaH (DUF805 family)